jgi:hypothetical protein
MGLNLWINVCNGGSSDDHFYWPILAGESTTRFLRLINRRRLIKVSRTVLSVWRLFYYGAWVLVCNQRYTP